MLKKTHIVIAILSACIGLRASAQELWGYTNSNYAGIMGLHLNPASIAGTPYLYEVNVIAADAFYDNNYLYIPKLSDLTTTTAEDGTQNDAVTVVESGGSTTKHAYASGLVLGPGFLRNKGKYSWAVHSAARVVASVNKVPDAMAKAFYTKFDYAPLHSLPLTDMKLQAAGMLLGNLGITYARVQTEREAHWLAWGVTLNGLVGFDGFYATADAGELVIPDSSSLVMNHVNLDYGHAIPADGSNGVLSPKGFGGSADIGLVYIHKRYAGAYECDPNADRRKRYDYKFGASLIDLGYVSFNKQSARYRMDDGSMQWYGMDTANFQGIEDFDRELSLHSTSTKAADHFGIFMPAAASIQFDYCFKPRWYANLSVVQRLPISQFEVYRANSIALVPRYETRNFEASISASIYEYEQAYLGAAFRYLFFVIGTDRVLSFAGKNVRSMDIFFGLKFNSCMIPQRHKKGGCPMNED